MDIDKKQKNFYGDPNALKVLIDSLTQNDPGFWNGWKNSERPVKAPNLNGVRLRGLDLRKYSFWKARLINSDFTDSDIRGVDFRDANLENSSLQYVNGEEADFGWTILKNANFTGANLHKARIIEAVGEYAEFRNCDLSETNLEKGRFAYSRINNCNLQNANLYNIDLGSSEIRNSDLSGAKLEYSILTYANLAHLSLRNANLWRSWVYGVSAWDIAVNEETIQNELGIDEHRHPWMAWDRHLPQCTAEGIEFAQFIGLVNKNESLGKLIDSVSRKMVLILGRFTPERLDVLLTIMEALREKNYAPVIFNFDHPEEKNLTETIRILGGLAGFVIADLSDPRSIPQEVGAIVPDFASVPLIPIICGDQDPYSMFPDWVDRNNVLDVLRYSKMDELEKLVKVDILGAVKSFREDKDIIARKNEKIRELEKEIEKLRKTQ